MNPIITLTYPLCSKEAYILVSELESGEFPNTALMVDDQRGRLTIAVSSDDFSAFTHMLLSRCHRGCMISCLIVNKIKDSLAESDYQIENPITLNTKTRDRFTDQAFLRGLSPEVYAESILQGSGDTSLAHDRATFVKNYVTGNKLNEGHDIFGAYSNVDGDIIHTSPNKEGDGFECEYEIIHSEHDQPITGKCSASDVYEILRLYGASKYPNKIVAAKGAYLNVAKKALKGSDRPLTLEERKFLAEQKELQRQRRRERAKGVKKSLKKGARKVGKGLKKAGSWIKRQWDEADFSIDKKEDGGEIDDKTKLVVVDENALGYILPETPNSVSILNSNRKSQWKALNNYHINQFKDIRLASEKDFDRLKVVFDGYRDDPNYIYAEMMKDGGEVNWAYIAFEKGEESGVIGVELGTPNHTRVIDYLVDHKFDFKQISEEEYEAWDEGDEFYIRKEKGGLVDHDSVYQKAYELGQIAYNEEKMRVPAHDKKLMEMITELNLPMGGNNKFYKRWVEGYEDQREKDVQFKFPNLYEDGGEIKVTEKHYAEARKYIIENDPIIQKVANHYGVDLDKVIHTKWFMEEVAQEAALQDKGLADIKERLGTYNVYENGGVVTKVETEFENYGLGGFIIGAGLGYFIGRKL